MKTLATYWNGYDEDIHKGQIIVHCKRIVGVALDDIPKGGNGRIQVGGLVNVTVADLYDPNDLDSILGLKERT